MLRQVKLPHRGKAHDYPKMQLAQLLILEYWRSKNHVTVELMKHNMSLMNEELGEISFGMLAQSVLGDSLRSDLEHMQKMFALLPIYRDVKRDVQLDAKNKNSISGRHVIKADDENVLAVGMFFRRVIRDISDNKYQSYDGSPASYKSFASAADHKSQEVLNDVFDPRVCELLPDIMAGIVAGINGSFLQEHSDLWPEAAGAEDSELDQSMSSINVSNGSLNDSVQSDINRQWGAPWSECQVGKLALGTCEFPGTGFGIAVYRILEKHEDRLENDELVRTFSGCQLQCSVVNTDIICLKRGLWRAVSARAEVVHDWEIASYFDYLNASLKLPAGQVAIIQELTKTKTIFQSQLAEPVFSD